jgi:DNA mismatch repair protein MutS
MRDEYLKFYKEHSKKYGPNTCIFLEVGKFYEMYDKISLDTGFGETSMKRAVELLNIQISYKDNNEIFAGVPEQSLHKFASVLTREGWTVVVINQVKDDKGKVIERKVGKILSPGTHVEACSIDALYVGTLYLEEQSFTQPPHFSISVADVSTGQCKSFCGTLEGKYDSWNFDRLVHFFQVHPVKELLVVWKEKTGSLTAIPEELFLKQNLALVSTLFHKKKFIDYQLLIKQTILTNAFKNSSLLSIYDKLSITQNSRIEASLVSLIMFLNDHFPSLKNMLDSHTIWNPDTSVFLGNNVLNQLNMISNMNEGIQSFFKKTFTSFGKREMLEYILKPICDLNQLNNRIDKLDTVYNLDMSITKKVEYLLKQISDLPRIHHKFILYSINAQDVLALDQSYSRVIDILDILKETKLKYSFRKLQKYLIFFHSQFDIEKAKISDESLSFLHNDVAPRTYEIEEKIKKEIEKANIYLEKIHEEAKLPPNTLRFESKDSNMFNIETSKKIGSILQKIEIKDLTVNLKKSSASVSSVVLEQIHAICLNYQSKLVKVMKEELIPICNEFFDTYRELWTEIEKYVSNIDILFTLSNVCKLKGFVKPIYEDNTDGSSVNIEGLRHPLIEQQNTQVEYVCHNVKLDSEGWLLYGMNASGKSSLMKAVGISVLLAQVGCYVPCSSLTIRPFKSIFTRILNQDNIWAGLSSFAVEMLELREILKKANQHSLVLGDELCSGTESVSATSLVASGIVWLCNLKASFIFATHLHGLNDLEIIKNLKNLNIYHLKVHYDVANDKLIYDRNLEKGSGNTYYGLEVARAMNIPHDFLELAISIRKTILKEDIKQTSYNKNIAVHSCEICKCSISNMLEVHHIIPQKDANNSILPNKQNKDHIRNLIVVCQTCHDKHHSNIIEIGSVKQTSNGLERTVSDVKTPPKRSKYTDEEKEIIQSYLLKYKNLSPKRIAYDLEKNEDIHISESSLRLFKSSGV